MKKLIAKYLDWFFDTYKFNAKHLSLYRLLFLSSVFIITGVPQYSFRIENFPEGFFNPPPFFSLFFNSILPQTYFNIVDVFIPIGLFFVLIGFRTKLFGILTSLVIIISNGFIFSTGKIDHSFLIWFLLFILSFSGWGNHYSLDSKFFNKKFKVNNWTISLYSMAIGFAFFTAGMVKLVSGWLNTSDSMLRLFFYRNYYIQGKQDYLASNFEFFSNPLFWELGDWFTIFFEIGFLYVIFWPSNFRFFTLLAVFFHGLVLLMFNIAFSSYLVVYLLFWIPLLPNGIFKKIDTLSSKVSSNKLHLTILYLLLLMIFSLRVFIFDNNITHVYLLLFFITAIYILFFKASLIFRDSNIQNDEFTVIKFDGVCNLCNSFVQFVIKRDKRNKFKFSPLQAEITDKEQTDFETIILEKEGEIYDKSSAFANIVREMKGGWPYLYLTTLVPKPIRNLVYSLVAKYRYKLFGKQDSCMIPTDDLKDKFL